MRLLRFLSSFSGCSRRESSPSPLSSSPHYDSPSDKTTANQCRSFAPVFTTIVDTSIVERLLRFLAFCHIYFWHNYYLCELSLFLLIDVLFLFEVQSSFSLLIFQFQLSMFHSSNRCSSKTIRWCLIDCLFQKKTTNNTRLTWTHRSSLPHPTYLACPTDSRANPPHCAPPLSTCLSPFPTLSRALWPPRHDDRPWDPSTPPPSATSDPCLFIVSPPSPLGPLQPPRAATTSLLSPTTSVVHYHGFPLDKLPTVSRSIYRIPAPTAVFSSCFLPYPHFFLLTLLTAMARSMHRSQASIDEATVILYLFFLHLYRLLLCLLE